MPDSFVPICATVYYEMASIFRVDNFFTDRKANIAHLIGNPYFELMHYDVTSPFYVGLDQVNYLTCPASLIHYQHDPVQTTKTCVHGAINMIGLAKHVKARVFQASTSEVYGDPKEYPQSESYWVRVNPFGARSCYDERKCCAEILFFHYKRQHNMDIKVGCIFTPMGRGCIRTTAGWCPILLSKLYGVTI